MDAFWQHCLDTLRTRFDAETFDAFIQPASLSLDDTQENLFLLSSPNTATKRWLHNHVAPILSDLIKAQYGDAAELRSRVFKPATTAATAATAPSEAENAQLPPTSVHNGEDSPARKQTFGNFIPGRANELPLIAAKKIAEGDNTVNPLFLYGSTGLGKTHLMQAIKNRYQQKFPNKRILYTSGRAFLNEVVSAVRLGQHDRFLRRYKNLDLLLVDDIQYIGGDKVRTQEEFFFLFNALYESNKSIVLSSDRAPALMDDMPDRLTTRFSAGLPTLITPPEFELRVGIVRQKSKERKLALKEEIIHFIAEHIKSNVRELEGAIIRMQALAQYQGMEVSVDMCRNAINDLIGAGNIRINTDTIIQKTAIQYHLRPSDITSRRRHRNIAKARHIAAYLCRQMTSLSLPQIGQIFGGRNHTTIIHSCEQIEEKIKNDPALWDEIKRLEAAIKG